MELLISGRMREVCKIKPSELKSLLPEAEVILIYGKSGRGKSAIVKEYAIETSKRIKVFSLATEMPECIGGIPYKTKEEYFIKLLNVELEEVFENEGEDWVIFFDEINQASQEVLNALYSICHPTASERNWAGHSLAKAQIVAAGNLDNGDDGTVYLTPLPTPLHNRFHIFELVDNATDTKAYLKKKWKNIPQVAKYIDVLLTEDIPPRDIDQCLEKLAFSKSSLWLQSKLGSALTTKLYNIQKSIKTTDPAEVLRGCRETYNLFTEEGVVRWGSEYIRTEEELIDKFKEILSDEEIQGIIKGGK